MMLRKDNWTLESIQLRGEIVRKSCQTKIYRAILIEKWVGVFFSTLFLDAYATSRHREPCPQLPF